MSGDAHIRAVEVLNFRKTLSYSCPAIEGTQRPKRLIILLICVGWIAAVASVQVGAILIYPQFTGSHCSKVGFARCDIAAFETAIDAFQIDAQRFPTAAEGFSALVSQPANVDGWAGPYIKKPAVDPWGSPYVYIFPGTHHHPTSKYDIFSPGPDGKPGTADDIESWK